MSEKISLKKLEQNVFKNSIHDGVFEILLGSYLLLFVVAIFLSKTLGDFWSTAVILPIWLMIYLVLRMVRKKMIQPRVGKIEYGSFRKKKLMRMNIVMLIFNIAALILGILSFFQFANLPDWVISARFSIILLIGFSLAGYMLNFTRLYIYGLLIAAAPLVGEFLYQNYQYSHHGLPVTLGLLASVLIIIGIIIMFRIFRTYPIPGGELPE